MQTVSCHATPGILVENKTERCLIEEQVHVQCMVSGAVIEQEGKLPVPSSVLGAPNERES